MSRNAATSQDIVSAESSSKSLSTASFVVGGIGVAAIAAGVTLVLLNKDPKEAAAAAARGVVIRF